MNAIIGMTDLALATELTDQQQEYLQTVRSSSESLLNLLNDILDLSKIEAGKMEMEEIDFDLREVVQDAVRTLAAAASEKGLTLLTTQLADDLPRIVRGDPTKLRQVLLNLVGNAIKFTQQGEVVVTAEQQWRSDEEIALHFWCGTRGSASRPRSWTKFSRRFGKGTRRPRANSAATGLGLTISSELVRMMRGRIWVESTPGRGSTFHFTVQLRHGAPLALPSATPDSSRHLLASRRRPLPSRDDWRSAPRVRPLQVLVADDHTANRQLVTSVLSSRGHACTEAVNGGERLRPGNMVPLTCC